MTLCLPLFYPVFPAGKIKRSERKVSSYAGFAEIDLDGPASSAGLTGASRGRSGSVISTYGGFGDDANDINI